MTTTYASKHQPAGTGDKKRWGKRKKALVLGLPFAAVLTAGAAWAAVALYGFGDFESDAVSSTQLTIVGNPTTSAPLVPGATVGVTGVVHNGTSTPVKITGIIIKSTGLSLTPAGRTAAQCLITLHSSGTPTDFPANGSAAAIPNGGKLFTLVSPPTVNANSNLTVTVPNVLQQAATATELCGVKGSYAVVGSVGS